MGLEMARPCRTYVRLQLSPSKQRRCEGNLRIFEGTSPFRDSYRRRDRTVEIGTELQFEKAVNRSNSALPFAVRRCVSSMLRI